MQLVSDCGTNKACNQMLNWKVSLLLILFVVVPVVNVQNMTDPCFMEKVKERTKIKLKSFAVKQID